MISTILPACRKRVVLWSQADPVGLNLGVEGSSVHSQQACGPRLMTSCLLQCPANQIHLKASHLIIKIDATTQVSHCTDAGAFLMHEGFHVEDPARFTRPWFAWANAMFSEFVLAYCSLM